MHGSRASGRPEEERARHRPKPGSRPRRGLYPHMRTSGPPLPLPGWDDPWPAEWPFQAVAVFLAQRAAGATVHVLDTSKLAIPDDYNRTIPGAPDIVASVDGRYVEIELKTRNGKQTRPQTYEQERVENAGSKYAVCRTVREVFEALELEVPAPAPESGNESGEVPE